jgi:S-adenosylmethionine:tRNA ribosyltransferase-isomerase
MLRTTDFIYDLPEELIASHPPKVRGTSSLLVLNRKEQEITKTKYYNLDEYLRSGDVLVLNNTKVIKARLQARKLTGGQRELVVLENHGRDDDWFRHYVLYHGRLKVGDELLVGDTKIEVLEICGNGTAEVKCQTSLLDLCDKYGAPPLPPYIKRQAEAADVKRYQTVFAELCGSVAAPTASLNMTDDLLKRLHQKGVKIVNITLHVGLGTFLPIREIDVAKHQMHREYFEIPIETVAEIGQAKQDGRRVVAVGTTVARTLEHATSEIQELAQKLADEPEFATQKYIAGEADIFIYPGYKFKLIDGLLTNFHAPKSTVLMLTAAFAGWPFLKQAYDFAINEKMHFLSYGDSMLII